MLTLNKSNIYLGLSASDKTEAIRLAGQKMVANSFTSEAYIAGLLAREQISSTYLGNGIAIPHGTPDSRDAVSETGVVVLQFPGGVDWGNGEKVYVAVGIAARSNEHLEILTGLTRVLDNDSLCKQLATTDQPEVFLSAIQGRDDRISILSESLIQCRISVSTALGLKAIAASILSNAGYVNEQGEKKLLEAETYYLGDSIALISTSAAEHTGLSIVVPEQPVVVGERKVAIMVAIAANSNNYLSALNELASWEKRTDLASVIAEISSAELLKVISGEGWPTPKQANLSREFVIHNANGLHARPGKVFVSTIKPFEARVEVCNPNKSYDFVNGKSLMKLLSLGITKGTSIEVRASGSDADQALNALEKVIVEGLGE